MADGKATEPFVVVPSCAWCFFGLVSAMGILSFSFLWCMLNLAMAILSRRDWARTEFLTINWWGNGSIESFWRR
jgi:hypothetical protein